jgi:hypothetical protein
VLLATIAIVFGAIGTVVFGRSSTDQGALDDAELRPMLTALVGSMCHLEDQVRNGDLAAAKNTFWDEVHVPTHALSYALRNDHPDRQARLLEAKAPVERGFATLAPSLRTDVPPFEAEVRLGLKALAIPGAQRPC